MKQIFSKKSETKGPDKAYPICMDSIQGTEGPKADWDQEADDKFDRCVEKVKEEDKKKNKKDKDLKEAAEKKTSAEIKVVIARHCWGNIQAKAMKIFAKHNLHETAQRNCVLILLVIANRDFVIFGDKGIHEKAGQELWDSVRNKMGEFFRQDKFGDGLAAGVQAVGEKLIEFLSETRTFVSSTTKSTTPYFLMALLR